MDSTTYSFQEYKGVTEESIRDAFVRIFQYLKPSIGTTVFIICILIALVGIILVLLITQNKKLDNKKINQLEEKQPNENAQNSIQENNQDSTKENNAYYQKKADLYCIFCFAFALISLFFNPLYLFSILGLAFSGYAINKHKSAKENEMRKVGVVLTIIGLIKSTIALIILIITISSMSQMIYDIYNISNNDQIIDKQIHNTYNISDNDQIMDEQSINQIDKYDNNLSYAYIYMKRIQ